MVCMHFFCFCFRPVCDCLVCVIVNQRLHNILFRPTLTGWKSAACSFTAKKNLQRWPSHKKLNLAQLFCHNTKWVHLARSRPNKIRAHIPGRLLCNQLCISISKVQMIAAVVTLQSVSSCQTLDLLPEMDFIVSLYPNEASHQLHPIYKSSKCSPGTF